MACFNWEPHSSVSLWLPLKTIRIHSGAQRLLSGSKKIGGDPKMGQRPGEACGPNPGSILPPADTLCCDASGLLGAAAWERLAGGVAWHRGVGEGSLGSAKAKCGCGSNIGTPKWLALASGNMD